MIIFLSKGLIHDCALDVTNICIFAAYPHCGPKSASFIFRITLAIICTDFNNSFTIVFPDEPFRYLE